MTRGDPLGGIAAIGGEVSEDYSYFNSHHCCRATLILAIALRGVGFDPAVLIGSIAAVIGGTVVFGSNTSTLKQTAAVIKAAEAHRAELISQIDLCVVGDGNSRTAANDLGPRPSPYRSRPRLQNGP